MQSIQQSLKFLGFLMFSMTLFSVANGDKPIMDPKTFSGENREAYELAVKYEKTIKGVKCHCGCMQAHNHKGLHTCFETDHSTHCTSCKAEMFRVAELKKEGKSDKEVSKIIDTEFAHNGHQH